MKIESLDRYGIPGEVIKRWRLDGVRFLLHVQSEAVTRFGLLDGANVIISGPGTSGKTFCGELAALAKAASRQKAFFLVPFKAIAEEKFDLFRKRYSPLGMRIRLATRDRFADDCALLNGEFDIAIIIYEKFNCLTATDVTLIKNTSCFILDEFQMVSDSKRGLELELTIAKIKAFNPDAQTVIMMGGGSSAQKITQWLNIKVLEENRRPVDLRLGVLHRGTFHFRGFNDLNEGDERWLQQIDPDENGPLTAQNLAAIGHLAEQGEQILVFMRSRKTAEGLAEHLSSRLNLPTARESVEALAQAPPSIQNEKLERCLARGVAFHHAELDENQRQLVEAGFRNGEIRILSSTTTLAWGVNLPARNVFIETVKYSGARTPNSREQMVPLTGIDFHQAAGRAGRLGSKQAFGRAIMTAATPYEHEILWGKYIYGLNEDPPPGLKSDQLPEFVLRIICCGAATKPDEIERACRDTYSAHCGELAMDFTRAANDALLYLEKGGILAIKSWGKLEPTPLGLAASASGFSADSAIRIGEALSSGKITDPLEWLFFALHLREWTQETTGYHVSRQVPDDISSNIQEHLAQTHAESLPSILTAVQNMQDRSQVKALLAFLFAMDWMSGTPTRDLEVAYHKGAGGLKRDASTLSWIIRGIERIGRAMATGRHENAASFGGLGLLAERLQYGVNDSMLSLALALGIDREFIRRLYEYGITSCENLHESDLNTLSQIVPPAAVSRIQRWQESQRRADEMANSVGNRELGVLPTRSAPRIAIDQNADSPLTITFTGTHRGRQNEVIISGRSILLQPRLYSYLQKLWWAFIDHRPWVHRDSLDGGLNQAKYISKLRRILKDNETGIDLLFNGRGSYCLMFPPHQTQTAARVPNECKL